MTRLTDSNLEYLENLAKVGFLRHDGALLILLCDRDLLLRREASRANPQGICAKHDCLLRQEGSNHYTRLYIESYWTIRDRALENEYGLFPPRSSTKTLAWAAPFDAHDVLASWFMLISDHMLYVHALVNTWDVVFCACQAMVHGFPYHALRS